MSYELLYYCYGRLRHMYHSYISYNEFSANHILDEIYIGNVYDAHNIEKLNELNIKNVISAVTGFDNIYDKQRHVLALSLAPYQSKKSYSFAIIILHQSRKHLLPH